MEKKYVWLVRQTQPSAEYDQETIAVYDNKEQAVYLARELNKVYGKGCQFSEDWDYIDIDGYYDDCHYYDTDCQELNPKAEDYVWLAKEYEKEDDDESMDK